MALFPDLRPVREFTNREAEAEFAFRLRRSQVRPGVSALMRVRNESSKIELAIRSILPIFDEVVVVDNASDDDTVLRVEALKAREDRADKIRLCSYPFRLARFGPEHESAPEDSVTSAVYFSNWALSRCTCRTICKWDGDMVLLRAARGSLTALVTRMAPGRLECWSLAGQTIYRGLDGSLFEAIGEVNREVEVVPNGWGCRFEKRRHWERLGRPRLLPRRNLEPVAFAELKFVDEEEFGHWSTTDWPSPRKRREWENFQVIKSGAIDPGGFRRLPASFLDDQLR